MKRWLSLLLVLFVLGSVVLAGCSRSTGNKASTLAPATQSATAQPNPNAGDFTMLQAGKVDLGPYYAQYGVKCTSTITSMGGSVSVSGLPTTLPKAAKRYKIGLALYTTVDEVGSMVLEGTKKAAAQAGVDLLVNDCNYNQDAQNAAVEQWITEGVDGVILYPADFTACGSILEKLKAANIPVIGGNPSLAGTVNSVIMIDNVQCGQRSAQALMDAVVAKDGPDPKGTVVYQTLPFVHPNAATREAGFMQVMKQYPDVKLLKLTGISATDHYTALEGALQAHPDIIAGWAVYDSALIGMVNARNAAKKSNVLLAGIDDDRMILAGISKGDIVCSDGYNAYNLAYWSIDQIVNLLNGVEIPGMITVPNVLINKDNVSDIFKQFYGGRTLEDYLAGKRS